MTHDEQISVHMDDEKRFEDKHIDNAAASNMFANAASATGESWPDEQKLTRQPRNTK